MEACVGKKKLKTKSQRGIRARQAGALQPHKQRWFERETQMVGLRFKFVGRLREFWIDFWDFPRRSNAIVMIHDGNNDERYIIRVRARANFSLEST